MSFIIYEPDKKVYMMKNHKEVIVFDDEKTAYDFISAFYQYAYVIAMNSVFTEGFQLINDVRLSQDKIKVIEVPKDFNKKTINFNELRK